MEFEEKGVALYCVYEEEQSVTKTWNLPARYHSCTGVHIHHTTSSFSSSNHPIFIYSFTNKLNVPESLSYFPSCPPSIFSPFSFLNYHFYLL